MYKSPFSVAWRKPIDIDVNDPRAKTSMDFKKFSSRAGSEVNISGIVRDLSYSAEEEVPIGIYMPAREYTTINIGTPLPPLSPIAREYTTVLVV